MAVAWVSVCAEAPPPAQQLCRGRGGGEEGQAHTQRGHVGLGGGGGAGAVSGVEVGCVRGFRCSGAGGVGVCLSSELPERARKQGGKWNGEIGGRTGDMGATMLIEAVCNV